MDKYCRKLIIQKFTKFGSSENKVSGSGQVFNGLRDLFVKLNLKPGLHIVVAIAEHFYDHVPKRAIKMSLYRLQIFLVKYRCVRSIQLSEDQAIPGQRKGYVHKHVFEILTTYMEIKLK